MHGQNVIPANWLSSDVGLCANTLEQYKGAVAYIPGARALKKTPSSPIANVNPFTIQVLQM